MESNVGVILVKLVVKGFPSIKTHSNFLFYSHNIWWVHVNYQMKKIGGHFKKWNNQFLKCNWRACDQLLFSFAIWGCLENRNAHSFVFHNLGGISKNGTPTLIFPLFVGVCYKKLTYAPFSYADWGVF